MWLLNIRAKSTVFWLGVRETHTTMFAALDVLHRKIIGTGIRSSSASSTGSRHRAR
jgi:hypothetical protein